MPECVDHILQSHFEQKVKLDAGEEEKHRKVAINTIEGFIQFVGVGSNLDYRTQGSSFEGVKVGSADEFDFMILVCQLNADPGLPQAIGAELNRMRGEVPDISNFRVIHLPGGSQVADQLRGQWPGVQSFCLSAEGATQMLRNYLQKFVNAMNEYGSTLLPQGVDFVTLMDAHPALKLILYKDEDEILTIDISPGVRIGEQYFISKKTAPLRHVQDRRLELLWLTSSAHLEKAVIANKQEYERRNYRIVKSLLAKETDGNSFIWKTIFMSKDAPFPQSPARFIMEMMATFEGHLYGELRNNRRLPVEGSRHGPPLMTKFGGSENLLLRYGDQDLSNWHGRIKYLYSLLNGSDCYTFCREVGAM